MKLKTQTLWINIIPVVYLALALLIYFIRPKSLLSTDEALYLSEPSIFNGLGVYIVQLFFHFSGQSRLVIVFICFLIARFTISKIYAFENKRISSLLFGFFCFAIFNPYFVFHSSSFLKDSMLGCIITLFVIFFSKRKYVISLALIFVTIVLRTPLLIVLISMFIFYKINDCVHNKKWILVFNLFVLGLYLVLSASFGESDYYTYLVKIFENQRFDGSLTILGLGSDFYIFGLVVVINPILSLIGEFFNPIGSNLLLANSIYWVTFIIYLVYVRTVTEKPFVIPMYMSTLILTLPQVFLETAARYNLIIPFLFFLYFFMIYREQINDKS
ncbi:hypothetical protein OMR72_001795 [Vibrio parahaemolyticus]|uniref:hypothetical protein n=2 Tax=Vibrio parahaemolyticus TaxID=670 RepID=UPI001121882B|nr:hypothetical protein [Vibrio parahaemolyticus]EIJ2223051.1 hypothetical protein [Vibrio parahaemolyticus]EJG1011649.1 hypothetical protein [Vibrio parahaemolyticus]EJG1839670.1 hypothetical protein [Vibrio parahaemolyticus]EKA8933574.1 hypothetical protein [Vibrio parahaemolyticus]EKF6609245.1 hypothetical protein [Vibrio parahaemolyticus]